MTDFKLHLRAGESATAQTAYRRLKDMHGSVSAEEADCIVTLGGDGLMLETLHTLIGSNVPVYGMNLGTVGFLMNNYQEQNLIERIKVAQEIILHPLRMNVSDPAGNPSGSLLAINDVSLLRESPQTARIRIKINGITRMEDLAGDGVLVATSAGSTAYNASVHGPIIPMGTPALALTPISCARPRHWPGALLSRNTNIRFEIIDPEKRPVGATADNKRIENVGAVEVFEEQNVNLRVLYDPGHDLEERIIREQFLA